jgi:hypothetical protein
MKDERIAINNHITNVNEQKPKVMINAPDVPPTLSTCKAIESKQFGFTWTSSSVEMHSYEQCDEL